MQEYQTGISVPIGSNPDQIYSDLAWGGLQDTNTFKKLPFTDQQRILNVISIELTGTNTNGNSKQQNGKKAGC